MSFQSGRAGKLRKNCHRTPFFGPRGMLNEFPTQ
jgi:hypothetical protein